MAIKLLFYYRITFFERYWAEIESVTEGFVFNET